MNIDDLKLILLNKPLSEIETALDDFSIASFDNYGNNILHYYVKNYESIKLPAESIIQLSINRGIDINARQSKKDKRTALQLAVMKKAKQIFDILISNGADVNIQDGNGNVALSDAVFWYRNDDGHFIETLIAKGARVDIENNYGVTPKRLSDTIANYDSKKFFV